MFDRLADTQFRRDASGRVVFLPRGSRKSGYYIDDASDLQKIRAIAKLYVVAGTLFNLAGFLGSYALMSTWESVYFIHLPISIEARAMRAAGVYLISALVIQLTPLLILQQVYRESVTVICSNLKAVKSDSLGPLSQVSPIRRRLLVVLVGVLILLALSVIVIARR